MAVPGSRLHRPSPRRRLVPRERLLDRLPGPGGEQPRLVLIAAPAGFGKTTLLAQWLTPAGEDRSVAWLGLDPGDADPRRFLAHLVAAIRAVEPAVGEDAANLPAGDAASLAAAVLSLVEDLDLLTGPLVVALDDYHVVDSGVVHDLVTLLLDHLPPHVTLALTTRADPPLPLARLRARGELVEVRAADLRFTTEEAAAFLTDVMDLHLDARHVAALEARTEGWAAGLQLAALSARTHLAPNGSGDVDAFVAAFSGSHRFVLDYLLEEVLDRHGEAVQAFLLDTCVLEELTGDLCDALTGRADGRPMLEHLERENLFVVPLDDERRWYRYHHLFADALRARLAADRAAVLHAAAARWLAGNGFGADAVRHALAGGDHEYAADLVELSQADLRRRRQDHTLRAWLAALPADVVRRRPLLATAAAWNCLSTGDIEGVPAWLDAAEAALDAARTDLDDAPVTGHPAGALADREDDLRCLPVMIAVYRAAVAQAHGDVDDTVTHARRALALAGPQDHFPRGAAGGFLGLAAWAAGDLAVAVEAFTPTVAALRAAGMVADALGTTVVLANLWLARGRPAQARRLYEEALAEAQRHPGPALPVTSDLHVGLADVLREQGDLDAAAHHLEVAAALGDRASLPENRYRRHTAAAGLARARGDLEGAVALLDRAEPLFLPGYLPDLRPIAATRARVQILQGRLADARAWADRRGLTPQHPPSAAAGYDLLTLARLLVAEGEAGAAVDLLDRLLDAAGSAEQDSGRVEGRLVRALAHRAAGDPDAATADLAAAVLVGVPAGYCRLFLDEGAPVPELLTQLVRGATAEVRGPAERLLAAAGSPPPGVERAAVELPELPEPLSEREREVLGLLAGELTGPQIARRLFVSVNTLRTHTKRIFTKLDVNSRRAAVARAAALGLLPAPTSPTRSPTGSPEVVTRPDPLGS